jgi:predicted adenylyl cyclase CyaB
MPYEVERRVGLNCEYFLPTGSQKSKEFSKIRDVYFQFPDPMVRVRSASMIYPHQKSLGAVCMKTREGEILELESDVEKPEVMEQIFYRNFGKPKVVVSGKRKEYKLDLGTMNVGSGIATINIDDVEGLGTYTEVEVMADSKGKIDEARGQVNRIFDLMGVKVSQLEEKTYAEMLYKKKKSNVQKNIK